MGEEYLSNKLGEYFSGILLYSKLGFLPDGVTFGSVSDFKRLSYRSIDHGVYSFVLTYKEVGREQRCNLVIKTYGKSLDPVLRTYANYESFQRCIKEFQVLIALERVGFPVPRAFLCESNANVLGYPFLIMQKEDPIENCTDYVDSFAKNLSVLHGFDPNTLEIGALKPPEGRVEFARKCLLYLKMFLNLYPKHNKELKKDFEFALRWLESNVTDYNCNKYCLLHGDYRSRFNTIMTKGSRMVVLDWEDAQIGDPAYDVGVAYVRARADFGEKTADRFVQEYLRYYDGDVAERLFFYKLMAHLRLAIIHSSVFSNPLRAYEIHGMKAFLSFPFLRLPFIAKNTGADLDAVWVKGFREFVEENFRR